MRDSLFADHCRRSFLTSSASGLGAAALGSLLSADGALAEETPPESGTARPASGSGVNPLTPRPSHFPARARACIFFLMEGAPSQLDLWTPKPKLNELHGQPLPASMVEKVRFAFIKKETATLMGSPRRFRPHGESGMVFSDLLPHLAGCADDLLMVRSMHGDQFNHHPGQLLLQCGRASFGLPVMGSWLTYGLGSESSNLPGYVVLSAGRGSSGGASLWQSGFLPSVYSGVLFRNQGEPVLNLNNPSGLPPELQRRGLDVLRAVNQEQFARQQDPEINSRISSYELAFRMQSAAPELIDLSGETAATLERYGVNRTTEPSGGGRGQAGQTRANFARNCLLSRRMVERGVRFVNIIYSSWDHHSNLDRELAYNSEVVDQPIAALIQDLKERGLLDETLVVWGSEFGRTPLGENRTDNQPVSGRDHHPFGFTLLMAGGGLKGGHIYGDTDEIGWGITEKPTHMNDFHATLLHLFGMDHLKLTHRFQGRDFRLTDVGGHVVSDWIA
jgi:hypothetical protein